MVEAVRRLKGDPENLPPWLRDELRALAARVDRLPPEDRSRVIRDQLSAQARTYLADQGRRAFLAYQMLVAEHRAR